MPQFLDFHWQSRPKAECCNTKPAMENIVVAVRFRPLNDRELKDNATTDNWKLDGGTATYSPSPSLPGQSFTFDQVYDPSTTTQQLYDGAASSIVASAVNGFNGTVFAYGQTSSGKTFTMRGSEANPGIIPMAIQQVFDNMDPERQYLFRVAYMEIYNEIVTDLLAGPGGGQGFVMRRCPCTRVGMLACPLAPTRPLYRTRRALVPSHVAPALADWALPLHGVHPP